MGEYISPWDFKTIYMDYFLGSPVLFVFALLLIMSYSCAYFQMSNKNFGLLLVISGIMFTVYLGQAYYFFIIIILGFILFRGLARFFN